MFLQLHTKPWSNNKLHWGSVQLSTPWTEELPLKISTAHTCLVFHISSELHM